MKKLSKKSFLTSFGQFFCYEAQKLNLILLPNCYARLIFL